jgi:hypothetical protein
VRRRAVVASLLCVVVASGCSLGPREVWAESIREGFETGRATGGAQVRQTVSIKVIETNIRQTPRPLIATSAGVVDFDERRARLVETAKRKTEVIYDDLLVYLKRSKSSVGRSGKSWARFDFEREPDSEIDDNDRRLAVGAGLISPVLAIEFLEGVLTGSVEEAGKGRVGGAQTTRYTARLAPDAVVTDLQDDDRGEGVTRLFETLGVEQDDFPVDVWLDDDEQVRGVRYVLRQQKDRVNAFELTITWAFYGYGTKANVKIPANESTIRSGRFRDFVEELLREFV